MLKKITISFLIVVAIPILFLIILLIYPRPVDNTPAWVFEGDSSEINYCVPPVLDGSGLMAKDVPHAHTPGCGYTNFPQPILRGCTEPLSEGATDLRGLWQAIDGSGRKNHVERIEQCGNRIVVTSSGLIHDMTTDGLLAGASDDVRPLKLGPFNLCMRTSATTRWKNGRLEFYALGGPHVVSRYIQDGIYQWDFPGFGNTKMKRICKLPDSEKTRPARG